MTDAATYMNRTVLLARDFLPEEEFSDTEIIAALTGTTIAIVADQKNASSQAGQTLVTTLATQALAMGCGVRILMPDVVLQHPQPPIVGRSLHAALVSYSLDLIPGVTASVVSSVGSNELVFVLGDTPWLGRTNRVWRLHGEAWWGGICRPYVAVGAWTDTSSVGAMIAATVAAAEPFKAALRQLAGPKLVRRYPELDTVEHARVRLGDGPPPTTQVELGDLDFISGGAITNASLHALLRIPQLSARVRVIEPEEIDPSNLNRYPLARRSHVGLAKTSSLERSTSKGINIVGVRERFEPATVQHLLPMARSVIVGVDNIPSRWWVQAHVDGWLGVGATAHFMTLTSGHMNGEPCAGCLHPYDDGVNEVIPTVSFVSYWAGLLVAIRLIRNAMGYARQPDRQALVLSPLRLDLRHSLLWQPVPRQSTCPVGCTMQATRVGNHAHT